MRAFRLGSCSCTQQELKVPDTDRPTLGLMIRSGTMSMRSNYKKNCHTYTLRLLVVMGKTELCRESS